MKHLGVKGNFTFKWFRRNNQIYVYMCIYTNMHAHTCAQKEGASYKSTKEKDLQRDGRVGRP